MLLDAVTRGRLYQVRFLLESGSVNVNARDQNGQTSLMRAVLLDDKMHNTRYKLVRILLDHGAKVNIADKNGMTALMLATILGRQEIAEKILKTSIMDLDINAGDREGNTALIHAAMRGHSNIARVLIKFIKRFGLDVDKKNNRGMTAMLEATRHGHDRTAQVLMVEGQASLTIRDPYNYMNTREWAVQNELHTLVELITAKQEILDAKFQDSDSRNIDETTSKLEVSDGELQVNGIEVISTLEPQRDVLSKRPSSRKKSNRTLTVPQIMQSLRDASLDDLITELEPLKPVTNGQEGNELDLVKTSHENEVQRANDLTSDISSRSCTSVSLTRRKSSSTPRLRSASSGLRCESAKSEVQRLLELYGVQSSMTYRKGYDPTTLPPSGMWPDPLAHLRSLSNSYENLNTIDREMNYFGEFMPSRTNSRRSILSEGSGKRMSIVVGPRDGRRSSIVPGGTTGDRRRKMTVGGFQGKGMFDASGRKPGDRKMSMIVRPNMERPTLSRRTNSTMSPLISS